MAALTSSSTLRPFSADSGTISVKSRASRTWAMKGSRRVLSFNWSTLLMTRITFEASGITASTLRSSSVKRPASMTKNTRSTSASTCDTVRFIERLSALR